VNSQVFCQDLKNEQLNTVEESAHSEMKEEHTTSLKVRIVGPFTTLVTLDCTTLRRIVINLDRQAPYEGTSGTSGCRVNTVEKPSNRKEGETDHRHRKHIPQTRRYGSMPEGHSGRIALRREQCDMTPGSQNREKRADIHC
jgi:hypothetical protein